MNSRLINNSKVLVTGGAGFIGSNLIEALLNNDNKVVCLDNLSTGKQENINPFLSNNNFTFIKGDIRDIDTCKEAVKGVDFVLQQAALGSVPRSIEDPKSTNDVNIGGFVNMLIAAKDEGVKRFVYAASSSTYGDHPALPKHEETIGNPLSPYAITKYVNELYAKNFSDLYGLQTIGLRYFNVFGRRQDPNGAYSAVIPKFVKGLINKEQITINGDGLTSRDFTYIDNVIQANQLAAITTNKNALNTVYNVAYGQATSLNELFTTLRDNLSDFDADIKKIEPVYGPERAGDVKHSLASIDKARKLLDYDPQYSFKQGIKNAVKWYWDNLK